MPKKKMYCWICKGETEHRDIGGEEGLYEDETQYACTACGNVRIGSK